MIEYIYERNLNNGNYNINNLSRVDGEDNPILLATEIKAQIDKLSKIICNANECKIIFSEELTPEEKILLDTLVSNHKNNI